MDPAAIKTPFSVHRTFVVQFRAATDSDQGLIEGRIEHVATKQGAAFQSWAEMQAFMARVLLQVKAPSTEGS